MPALRRPASADVMLAGALLVLCELEVALNADFDHRAIAAVFAVPMTLALAFRRQYPTGAVAVALAAFVAQSVFGVPSNEEVSATVVWVVGCYTISAHNELRRAVLSFAIPVIATILLIPTGTNRAPADILFIVAVLTIA